MTNNVYEKLRNQPEVKLLFSGKLGSGKDTIAEATAARLSSSSSRVSFAQGVRKEVNDVVDIIRSTGSFETSIEDVSRKLDVSFQSARDMVDILFEEVLSNPDLSAENRTNTMRQALQYWGPTVRRSQNPDYWIEKAMSLALQETLNGNLVYITDGRFPNEIDAAKKSGFVTIRLETSEDTRIARIESRDGKKPTREALYHASETALDTYVNFDLILDNNNNMSDTVDLIVSYVTTL